MRQPTYPPAAIIAGSGIGMFLFGILSTTDAGTVSGITLGAIAAGSGLACAWDVAVARRRACRDRLSERTVQRLTDRQQRDIDLYGWTPDDPRDPYR